MQPLLLIQASALGLRDLSGRSRVLPSNTDRLSIIDGHYYYDLGGDTTIKWQPDKRIPKKSITIEFWIKTPPTKSGSGYQYLVGAYTDNTKAKGFAVGMEYANRFGVGDVLYFITSDGAPSNFYYTGINTLDTVMHVACVMSNNGIQVYYNGVLNDNTIDATLAIGDTGYLTFGYAGTETPITSASYAKLHQLIIWDGAKYTGSFTPQYINYEQQDSYVSVKPDNAQLVSASFDGVIADRVLIKGAPTERKVVLYRRGDDKLIGKTWSDKAGNYKFENLDSSVEYYVLSIDHERNYNAVIQDMIRTT